MLLNFLNIVHVILRESFVKKYNFSYVSVIFLSFLDWEFHVFKSPGLKNVRKMGSLTKIKCFVR